MDFLDEDSSVQFQEPDNGSDHRAGTTILQAEKPARKPGLVCITLLFRDVDHFPEIRFIGPPWIAKREFIIFNQSCFGRISVLRIYYDNRFTSINTPAVYSDGQMPIVGEPIWELFIENKRFFGHFVKNDDSRFSPRCFMD